MRTLSKQDPVQQGSHAYGVRPARTQTRQGIPESMAPDPPSGNGRPTLRLTTTAHDMKNFFKKLVFGARVLLSKGRGEEETVSLPGRDVVVRHGGEGPPLVYLHSALGEGSMWLPFFQAWAKEHQVFVPL